MLVLVMFVFDQTLLSRASVYCDKDLLQSIELKWNESSRDFFLAILIPE